MLNLLRINKKVEYVNVVHKKDIVFIDDKPRKIKKGYITFLPYEIITKEIEISAKIKDSLIESVIKTKLFREIKEDFVFFYHLESNNENSKIYKVEIILKKEIKNILKKIKSQNIELITTDYHSLFNFSKNFFDNFFISIYISDENIVYASGENKLEFFRSIPTPTSIQELIDDINRTIIYFKQQSKNLFVNVLLSGDIEKINLIYEKINANISLPIKNIKNIDQKKFLKYFLIFGTLYSKENFLPSEIKEIKFFNKVFLIVILVLIGLLGYLGIKLYKNRKNLIENEKLLSLKKEEFINLKKSTPLLDKNTLNYYITFLKMQKKWEKSNIAFYLDKIKPILNYMPVVSLIADNENIVITFEKKYKNYQELIDQKEKIEQLLNNKSLKYFKIRPNYEKISLEIIIYLKREND